MSTREWFTRGASPYSEQVTEQIQFGLYGRMLDPIRLSDPIDRRRFPYPIFVDLLFWPAASVPFTTLRLAAVCVLAILTTLTVPLWLINVGWRIEGKLLAITALFTLSSYPVLEGLYADQLGLLVAFVLAASLYELKRGHFLFAGFLMALTTAKPQVTLLLILYLLCWSFHDLTPRKNFILGFVATLALLIGAPLLVRPNWIQEWISTVAAYHQYTPPPLIILVLTSQLAPSIAHYVNPVLTLAIVALAVLFAWKARQAKTEDAHFWMAISILLAVTTIALLPGQAVYDHVILLPGILFLFKHHHELGARGQPPAILQGLGLVVLFWPWILAMLLVLLLSILPRQELHSSALLALPIRTAASLPFAVLALLVWNWRITLRQSKTVC